MIPWTNLWCPCIGKMPTGQCDGSELVSFRSIFWLFCALNLRQLLAISQALCQLASYWIKPIESTVRSLECGRMGETSYFSPSLSSSGIVPATITYPPRFHPLLDKPTTESALGPGNTVSSLLPVSNYYGFLWLLIPGFLSVSPSPVQWIPYIKFCLK